MARVRVRAAWCIGCRERRRRREGGGRGGGDRRGGACTATWHSRYGSTSVTRLRGSPFFTLRFAADTDASPRLFCHSQALRDLQVVSVLFEHNLRRAQDDVVVMVGQVLGIAPAVKLRNSDTDSEVALTLRVLKDCCLLFQDSTAAAHRYDVVKIKTEPLAVPSYIEVLFMRDPNAGAAPTNVLWPPWAHGRSCLQLTRRKHVLTELSCYAVASDFQKL